MMLILDKNRKILFVDMDGVLAAWEEYYITRDEMLEDGFFLNLAPIKSVINAVKVLIKKYTDIDVYVLTSVLSKQGIHEKNLWLDRYLPEITADRRIFVNVGTAKSEIMKGYNPANLVLLDDYTKNLREWRSAGGRGICLLNGDNAVSGKWTGDYVFYKTDYNVLASTLHALVIKE